MDSNKYFAVDIQSGSRVPYFVGKEINLKHLGLNTDLGLDWKISDYFYLSGGLTLGWNFRKRADVYDRLIFPPGFEMVDGSGREKLISDRLNSLSTLNWGVFIGPGLICSIGRGFQVFTSVNYYYFPFSILSDADLFQRQLNIKFGIKYQL